MDWRKEMAGIILSGGSALALAVWFWIGGQLKKIEETNPEVKAGPGIRWVQWAGAGFVLMVTSILYMATSPGY